MGGERSKLVPQPRLHTRDNYGSIREAFRRRDVDASREAHKQERMARAAAVGGHGHCGTPHHAEQHGQSSEYLRATVFGGMDGAITIFALIAAAAGAGSDYATVMIIGIAIQLADALAMGFGEYVSTNAERQHAIAERERELWEVENCFDGEVLEMIEVYMGRGLSEEDATRIVQIMSKNPITFVEFMMVDELGIILDVSDQQRPMKLGLVTFASFLLFSFVPMCVFSVAGRNHPIEATFLACAVATALVLAVLGAVKGYLMDAGTLRTALQMVANGAIAGGLSYSISHIVSDMLSVDGRIH